MYNYIMKILLDRIITKRDKGKKINILCDNKDTKITSRNSFKEYIKLHFNYDKGYEIDFNIRYLDSDAGDAYIVQAADYVANAIYTSYEYQINTYIDLMNDKTNIKELFPYKKFGK